MPPVDTEEVVTGIAALTTVANTWQRMGQGKVESEYIEPYLVIRRANGEYTLFVPITAEEAVLIKDDDATTRHIPKELRATDDPSDEAIEKVTAAFEGDVLGMYPLEDEAGFGVGMKTDAGAKDLIIPAEAEEPYITED